MTPDPAVFDTALATKVHHDATALCSEITGFFFRKKLQINETIFVPVIIFARIIRLRDAALILTKEGFSTEAGILVLSQFEAKLDLAQAVIDPKWATRWVEHQNSRQSVTPNITNVIPTIFEDEEDRITELSTFRALSALKHGNPASSELGFQVRRTGRTFAVSTGEMEDETTKTAGAMIAGYATCQLAWVAQALNATIRQYAICDPGVVQAVHDNWQRLSGFGQEFAAYLSALVEGRAGHLDITTLKRNRPE